MAIRMTGLQSGLDTEAIVEQLMEAQRTKQTKIKNKKTTLEWKKDIWSSLNTKLNTFHQSWAGKMRLQANYKTKKAVSSNENKLVATAKSTAANGAYSVQVQKIAKSQYVTGGKLVSQDGKKVTASTKLSDLKGDDFKEGSEITIKNGEKTVILIVDSTTTVGDFVTSCNQAGLSASLDANQQRVFIGASASGSDGAFTITASQSSDAVVSTRSDLRNALDYNNLSSSDKSKVNTAMLNYASYINSTDEAEQEKAEKALQTLKEIAEKNAKSAAQVTVKEQYIADYKAKFISEDEDGNVTYVGDAEADAEFKAIRQMSDEEFDNLSNAEKAALAKTLVEQQTSEKKVAAYMKTDEAKEKVNDIVAADADNRNSNIETLAQNYLAAEEADSTPATSDILSAVGLAQVDGTEVKEGDTAVGMAVIGAQDTVVVVNGATLTSSTTTLEVNGLSLELKDETAVGESINVTVSNDTSAVYDMVKDFIKEYNALLKEMNTMYYADSAKGYDPLTDEQKEEMSDDEIEKWEKKIKDSLLRRDDTLESVINIMKNAMMGSVEVDGKKYSLSSLGIMTSTDYTEKGLLHIYGDKDDTVYADKDNKLQEMIDSDPDFVMNILTGLTTNLYNNMSKKMQKTSLSSSLTFYNDQQMTSQIKDYEKQISKWETKLKEMEDRYYSQFTAMEKALASLQSQQSALSGLLG